VLVSSCAAVLLRGCVKQQITQQSGREQSLKLHFCWAAMAALCSVHLSMLGAMHGMIRPWRC
jgi:hypothetical protein